MHRDLKPQNILVCSNGTIKICDFGQAKMTAVNYFCHSLHVSTLHYRAPEILAGSKYYSFGCDIWATGIIMWELF
jgi:serine/threonine protein kinase